MSIIFDRVSTRNFIDRKIEEKDLELILRAAMAAPSANNKQPWHFIVIRNKKTFQKIMEFHPYAKMLQNADVVIAACGDLKLEEHVGYLAVDLAACTQNILLQAEELKIGTCWLGIYPRAERMKELKNLLELPDEIVPISLIALGHYAKKSKNKDRYQPERIRYDKW